MKLVIALILVNGILVANGCSPGQEIIRTKTLGDIIAENPSYCPSCSFNPRFYYVNGQRVSFAQVPLQVQEDLLDEYEEIVDLDEDSCSPTCKALPVYIDLDDQEDMITFMHPGYGKFYSKFGDPHYHKPRDQIPREKGFSVSTPAILIGLVVLAGVIVLIANNLEKINDIIQTFRGEPSLENENEPNNMEMQVNP